MSSTITVRDIEPSDKSWLQQEARRLGVSMEELVRQIIREKREKSRARAKPSEAFRRHFGPEHGIELPSRGAFGYQPIEFDPGDEKAPAEKQLSAKPK